MQRAQKEQSKVKVLRAQKAQSKVKVQRPILHNRSMNLKTAIQAQIARQTKKIPYLKTKALSRSKKRMHMN